MALATPSSTQLGCGRDIDQVWDHLDQAPDAHELTCPYCRAARTYLAGLASATQAMRDDDATNPDLEPGPGVLDRILAVARAEVRRGRRLPLDQPRADVTSPNTVSEQAVTAVVRRVGDRTRQVQIRRCALTLANPASERPGVTTTSASSTRAPSRPRLLRTPGEALGAGPATVAVSLKVSVAADLAIVDATNQLRTAINEAIEAEVGMRVVSVDITVEDVHDA